MRGDSANDLAKRIELLLQARALFLTYNSRHEGGFTRERLTYAELEVIEDLQEQFTKFLAKEKPLMGQPFRYGVSKE